MPKALDHGGEGWLEARAWLTESDRAHWETKPGHAVDSIFWFRPFRERGLFLSAHQNDRRRPSATAR